MGVASVFSSIVGQMMGGSVSRIVSPVTNLATYAVNIAAPTEIPPWGMIAQIYHQGQLSFSELQQASRMFGAAVGNPDEMGIAKRLWYLSTICSRPRISPTHGAEWVRRGLIGVGAYAELCSWAGTSEQFEIQGILNASMPLDANELLEQYRIGTITQAFASRQIGWAGYAESARYNYLAGVAKVQSDVRICELYRRGCVTADQVNRHLSANKLQENGIFRASHYADIALPSVSQVNKAARLRTTDPNAPQNDELLQEFPHAWDPLYNAASSRTAFIFAAPNTGLLGAWDMAQIEWAGHWKPLDAHSVSKWRDMQRAANDGLAQYAIAGGQVYDDNYVREAARQEGILPRHRSAVVAATYAHLGHRQLLQLGQYADIDVRTIVAYSKLEGYTTTDAELLGKATGEHIRNLKMPWIHQEVDSTTKQCVTDLIDGQLYGLVGKDSMTNNLSAFGFNSDETGKVVGNTALHAQNLPTITAIGGLKRWAWGSPERAAKALVEICLYGGMSDAQLVSMLANYGLTANETAAILSAERAKVAAMQTKQTYEFNRSLALQAQRETWATVIAGVKAGLVDAGTAIGLMTSAGDSPAHASATVNLALAGVHERHVQQIVGVIGKAFHSGDLSLTTARQQLANVGLTPAASAEIIATWTAEQEPHHHQATAADILRWVKDGLLSPASAAQRLTNMGWSGMDAKLTLAEAENGLLKNEASAAKAAAQNRAKAAADLLKISQQAQKQQQAAIKQAQKYVSMSTLRQWYRQGIVSSAYVKDWFSASQYPSQAADAYIDSWQAEGATKHAGQPLQLNTSETIPGSGSAPQPG